MDRGREMTTATARQLRHGTHWMYMEYRCRCDECRDFHNTYIKRYKITRDLGAPKRLVQVDEARRQIHILEQMLFTQAHIAEASGVAQSHISRIAAGDTKRVRREIAEKINAGYTLLTSRKHKVKRGPRAGIGHPRVKPASPADDVPERVPLEDAQQIIDALQSRHRWSMRRLAEVTGSTEHTLRAIKAGKRAQVSLLTYERLLEADEMHP